MFLPLFFSMLAFEFLSATLSLLTPPPAVTDPLSLPLALHFSWIGLASFVSFICLRNRPLYFLFPSAFWEKRTF